MNKSDCPIGGNNWAPQDTRAEAALDNLMTDSQLFGTRFGRLEQEVQKNQKLVIMLLKVLTGDDDDKESTKQEFKNFMRQEEHELAATQITDMSDGEIEDTKGEGKGESKENTAWGKVTLWVCVCIFSLLINSDS